MTEERKYTYSIIKNPQEVQTPDSFRLSEIAFGLNNRDIVLVPYRDIAAAVSNTNLISFDKFDKEELTQFIAVHDQVNTGLMKKHDVVPMRFGMIAESTEEIRNILAKAYIQFKAALERVAGKDEFIVQVFWNEKNTFEKLLQEDSEIQKLKKEVESMGKILGFSSKIKLGKRIFEALESRRKKYTKDVLADLAAHFPNFSAGKLLIREMIMNYSFLIGKTEESALESLLNKLAEKYSAQGGSASGGKNELKFKYIGPMAPYSFAAINLSVGNFDLVDNARKTLGLDESATFLEIRDAYHKLAHEYHPDKQFFTKDQVILEETAKKMKDVVAANEILTVYCQYHLSALPSEKEQLCSFRKEDVEDSIIVKGSILSKI